MQRQHMKHIEKSNCNIEKCVHRCAAEFSPNCHTAINPCVRIASFTFVKFAAIQYFAFGMGMLGNNNRVVAGVFPAGET